MNPETKETKNERLTTIYKDNQKKMDCNLQKVIKDIYSLTQIFSNQVNLRMMLINICGLNNNNNRTIKMFQCSGVN